MSPATPSGRLRLSNKRLIVADEGQREELAIETEADERDVLRRRFGIELS